MTVTAKDSLTLFASDDVLLQSYPVEEETPRDSSNIAKKESVMLYSTLASMLIEFDVSVDQVVPTVYLEKQNVKNIKFKKPIYFY